VLITVDPHLHRVSKLEEAVPVDRAIVVASAGAMGAFLASLVKDPFLLGPDEESEQWVAEIAREHEFDYAVARKPRLSDREVRIELPDRDYADKNVVLVNDVASTGRTLEAAARKRVSASSTNRACVTITLSEAGPYGATARAAGVGAVWSTDSISHPTNRIYLADALASQI